MNKLVKAIALNDAVRIYCLNSKEMVEKARLTHDLWPTSLATLGRVSSISAIMAAMEKGDDNRIITQINGGGPIGTVMVEAKSNGDVRGFVGDNEIYLKYNDSNKLAVGVAVGKDGYLKITKDLGIKENFTGQVELQTGEIGDDFAYYFVVSEQTPSVVSCGVLVDVDNSCKSAGALLIQMLPNACEEDIVAVEKVISNLKPISTMLEEESDPEKIILSLFKDAKILETRNINWKCSCDKDRFKAGLTTIKLEDLQDILEKDKQVEVKCEYCNTKYIINEEELKTIIEFKQSCGK